MRREDLPLLLVDNRNVMSIINEGEFRCCGLSFEEAKAIIEMHDEADIIRCFAGYDLEEIVFDYLGIEQRGIKYKNIANMRVGQDAIAFKLFITPSETQPVIETPIGSEAKKIQNIYVYCQYITRIS
ncbi:hypothetical protein [Lachnoclostridium phytofermentans]|uniref:Uncharacterized protein n=1 Tax=Lachnoclostridium phytofermentans (strain ATCC 700394 / DSM 18823 / ISDg) TaxID=357809 RepID=A9KM48_LACP7|nr:hypothetical protein [Lachnoclostridium phytofermentans]ABX41391.1 hypothetical protein Cphy_1011 [Lachnoclostridium phytofermentans ISDg]